VYDSEAVMEELLMWSRRSIVKAGILCAGGALTLNSQKGLLAGMHTEAGGAASSDLTKLSIMEASDLLRRRQISPVELTSACLDRIERLNPVLNAFITVTADAAIDQARQAENDIQRKNWRGPLHGIPIGLKDLIDTAGIKTTCASAVFAERIPTQDAEVVLRLKRAGASPDGHGAVERSIVRAT